jgi:hypothetical protein
MGEFGGKGNGLRSRGSFFFFLNQRHGTPRTTFKISMLFYSIDSRPLKCAQSWTTKLMHQPNTGFLGLTQELTQIGFIMESKEHI